MVEGAAACTGLTHCMVEVRAHISAMGQRLQVRIALVLGGLLLTGHWLTAVAAWQNGRMFAWQNYWNAPVGTITAFIGLIFLTPAWVWALFHFWNWRGNRPWRN
jgi:hypothetical protein